MLNQDFDWNNLFALIGHRIRNENDLSDITWAFCKAYPKFQKIFLSFFFGNLDYSSVELIREYSKVGGRVDFYFKVNQQEYIIEVKIGDMSQHFTQYLEIFPNATRGYITNYSLISEKETYKEEYQIKTWNEFYKHLKSENSDDKAIMAYANYLKQVCNIFELEKMNLMNITSLTNLLVAIQQELEDNSKTTYLKSTYHDGSSGKNFSFKVDEKIHTAWYGIVYNIHGSSWITIYINNGTSMGFDYKFDNYNLIGEGENGDVAYFYFDKSVFDEVFVRENTSLENQQKHIADFLNQVIYYIEKHFAKIS